MLRSPEKRVVYPFMRGLILALLPVPLIAAAQPHSARECREGGDFIRNAALARDSGYTREFFLNRLEEDFEMIRAFPPQLRWFVRDPDDEEFLRGEVEVVFGAPAASELHRISFLERCIRRSERESSAGG